MMGIDEAARGWRMGDARGGVLVIADDAQAGAAEASVAAAGARALGRVEWAEARTRLDRQSAVAVVLAEVGGADDQRLAQVLPQLDLFTQSGDTRLVVALDREQIDLVAGMLTGRHVALLCAPTVAERVVALCLAGASDAESLHDIGRETEAARLRRLHEEVAWIAETLARLTRDEPGREEPRGLGEPGTGYRGAPGTAATVQIAPREIREVIRARRLRDQVFGAGLFEDPAWDMLLDLFAAELERAQVSVSSLCIAAAVAPTTALRWIARMTEAGLFERQPDPFDRRRAFMGLSERASAGMRQYIAAVRRTCV
jgi:hypothetical protein